eukprot:TRINITY_DN1927_c0_g1_i1.p1 TRINITY_DN1927_c0_g1~~TRINITY_DN1927_c0_g1_i1.p1  ORF type:complete len:437 (-),score=35.48 TRINITY_DN1927_c0_g1_i1:138-1448(-)
MTAHSFPTQEINTGEYLLYSYDSEYIQNGSLVVFPSLSAYLGESWDWERHPNEPQMIEKGVVGILVEEYVPSAYPGFDGLTRYDSRCTDYPCTLPIFSIPNKVYSFLDPLATNGTNITVVNFDDNKWEEWTAGASYTIVTSITSVYCTAVLLYCLYSLYALIKNGNFILKVGTVCICIETLHMLVRLLSIIDDMYGYRSDQFWSILFTLPTMLSTITTILLIEFWQDMTSKITSKIYKFLGPHSLKIAIGLSASMVAFEVLNNIIFAFVSVYDSKYRVAIYAVFALGLSTYYFFVSYRVVKQLNMLSIPNRRKIRATKMIVKIVACGVLHYTSAISSFLAVLIGSFYPEAWVIFVFLAYFSVISVSLTKLLLFTNSKSKSKSSSASSESTKNKSTSTNTNNAPADDIATTETVPEQTETETDNHMDTQTKSEEMAV